MWLWKLEIDFLQIAALRFCEALQMSLVKLLYWAWKHLTFIVTVIRWTHPIPAVEISKSQGGMETNEIWKSKIWGLSGFATHLVYYRTHLVPLNTLRKKCLLMVNSAMQLRTSKSMFFLSSMFKASHALWIEMLKSVNFIQLYPPTDHTVDRICIHL